MVVDRDEELRRIFNLMCFHSFLHSVDIRSNDMWLILALVNDGGIPLTLFTFHLGR